MADAWNIDAGELRQQIVIQTATVAGPNTRGTPQVSWPSIAGDPATGTLVRCKIETLSGRKLELARQLVATATHRVTMRYRAIDTETNRLVYKTGRVMNIGWQDDVDQMHVRLELLVTEQST